MVVQPVYGLAWCTLAWTIEDGLGLYVNGWPMRLPYLETNSTSDGGDGGGGGGGGGGDGGGGQKRPPLVPVPEPEPEPSVPVT
ncbi:hypothetical protein M0804_009602 [Polistes exclamans]|nr:hypothetical protein M0804_009602 [Polistes exclamans]